MCDFLICGCRVKLFFSKTILNGVSTMNDWTILVFKNQIKVQKIHKKIYKI